MFLKPTNYFTKSYILSIYQKYRFAQLPKKRTQAPKTLKNKQTQKIDPKNIDYNKIPEQYRKGVKAYVQATNMMVTSEAQVQALSLKEIILEQRTKLQQSLNNINKKNQDSPENLDDKLIKENKQIRVLQKLLLKQKQSETKINYYDIAGSLKFMARISSLLLASNISVYFLLKGSNKFQYLGFFLGLSLNPSIIALTGISIGFNCASWIIRQSLHLQIQDPNKLTLDKISLTGCSPKMYFQGMLIILQISSLCYYLMKSNIFDNFGSLLIASVLSHSHMIYNVIISTRGYRFQIFSKILLTFILGTFFIGSLIYGLLRKISDSKNLNKQGSILKQAQVNTLKQNFELKKGYEKFLQEFKTKDFTVFTDQTINKVTL